MTTRKVHTTAVGALNSAVKKKKLTYNPAQHIELPEVTKRRPLVWTSARVQRWQDTGKKPAKVMVWTPAHTGNFLDFVLDDNHYALWHLICYKPLRRSEVAGQAASDVDLDHGQILVRDSYTGVDSDETWSGDDEWDDTKSDTSERTLTLDVTTIEVIRLHLAKQRERRQLLGAAWVDSGRLFTGPTGAALEPWWISQKFERFIERHAVIRKRFLEDGWTKQRISTAYRVTIRAIDVALLMPLPPIRLHDTRHGAASLALAAGVDITIVSADCGHATTAFTRDAYQQVFPELARAAAEATADIVPRGGVHRASSWRTAYVSTAKVDTLDGIPVSQIPGNRK